MDTVVCPGCGLRVEPIYVLGHSPKSKQWWRIAKCPRERCGFNIDLVECDKPAPKGDKKPEDGYGGRFFWNNGL